MSPHCSLYRPSYTKSYTMWSYTQLRVHQLSVIFRYSVAYSRIIHGNETWPKDMRLAGSCGYYACVDAFTIRIR
jgi:hypothetical protein